ncbi:P-loop containing nucleoside triphosphate hydrolase protein [Serendipita vermifera]|nr:P-loop containing nucleoside triphosphate hydrolase protein [Serendipita vermifera]
MSQRTYRTPTIVVFGESGAGKSSVVNMFDGEKKAEISKSAVGADFQFQPYERTIYDEKFNVIEIVALSKASKDVDRTLDAVSNLWELVRLLEGGVNLLVYVMRGRITESAMKNYKMFFEGFCQSQVPIVLVVTEMENEAQPEDWWERNKQFFNDYGMKFSGQSCITAFKGKMKNGIWTYQEEYDEATWKVQDLVKNFKRQEPWSLARQPWFETIFIGFIKFGVADKSAQNLYKALLSAGISEKEARELPILKLEMEMPPGGTAPKGFASGNPVHDIGIPNVIIFGATGVGKSSVVNMLVDLDVAKIDNGATGTTLKAQCYIEKIEDKTFALHDTAGLDEGEEGSVDTATVVQDIWNLLSSLSDGVSLLVYVVRNRLTAQVKKNYEMFHNVLCQKSVKMVLVVTHMDEVDDEENWWKDNSHHFRKYGIEFADHACVVASRGKKKGGKYVYEDEYNQSKSKLKQMISEHSTGDPWTMKRDPWFQTVVIGVFRLRLIPGDLAVLTKALCAVGIDESTARRLAMKAIAKKKFGWN